MKKMVSRIIVVILLFCLALVGCTTTDTEKTTEATKEVPQLKSTKEISLSKPTMIRFSSSHRRNDRQRRLSNRVSGSTS